MRAFTHDFSVSYRSVARYSAALGKIVDGLSCLRGTGATRSMCSHGGTSSAVRRSTQRRWAPENTRNDARIILERNPKRSKKLVEMLQHHEQRPARRYQLFGVAQHTGSLSGGHYTAVCRAEPDAWHQFNDSQVRARGSCFWVL